jgi:multidrug efflux pump subunit AcrA (membrane-fusion protein)
MAAAFYMDSIGMDAIKNFKKHMRSKQALWLGIMMLLLLTLLWMLFNPKRVDRSSGVETRLWVKAVQVVSGDFRPQASMSGQMTAERVSNLVAPIAGEVTKVWVHEGDLVEKGQNLVDMDDKDLQLLLGQKQAQIAELTARIKQEKNNAKHLLAQQKQQQTILEIAKKNVQRQYYLLKQKASTPLSLDQHKNTLAQAEQHSEQMQNRIGQSDSQAQEIYYKLKQLKLQKKKILLDIQRSKVVAPFSGRVIDRHVSVAERLQMGQPLLRLYDPRSLEARVFVPQRFLPQLKAAERSKTPIKAWIAYPKGLRLNLLFSRVSHHTPAGAMNNLAWFRVKDAQGLNYGRPVVLKVELPALKNVLKLPTSALQRHRDVYVIHKGKLQQIKIERKGMQSFGNKHYILFYAADLRAEDYVLNQNLPYASSGLEVRMKSANPELLT